MLQSSAATINDVLTLEYVVMIWGGLAIAEHQKLLGIDLLIFGVVLVPVPDCYQTESDLVKITQAEIGNVPSKHVVPDLVILMVLVFPLLRSPVAERGKRKTELLCQRLHLLDDFVDFRSLHSFLVGFFAIEMITQYLRAFTYIY